MLRLVRCFLPCALIAVAAAQAVIPPGYQGILDLTTDIDEDNLWPAMNNKGQIVWSHRSDPWDDSTAEIWLYDNGVITQLTSDRIRDAYPDINDAGQIVWSRAIGSAGTLEIVRYEAGVLTRLTYDGYSDSRARINNNGCITWYKVTHGGCRNADADIYVYDGAIRRLTFGGYSNQAPELNDVGDAVWTRFNFCHTPWTATIMLRYADGTVLELTDDNGEPELPRINNRVLVAWSSADPPLWEDHIQLWQDGVTTTLTDWGSGLNVNNMGDVRFNRWHDDSGTWQVWLYRGGEFYQITADSTWNCEGDIDDRGNVVFVRGDAYTVMTNVRLLRRLPSGDVNCDGTVNAFDIDPFVLALVNLGEYQAQYADCDYTLADLNLDGLVNAFDIDPFVDTLTR